MKKLLFAISIFLAFSISAFAEISGETKTIGEISYFLPDLIKENFSACELDIEKTYEEKVKEDEYDFKNKYKTPEEFVKAIQNGTYHLNYTYRLCTTGKQKPVRINGKSVGFYFFVIGLYTGTAHGDIGSDDKGYYQFYFSTENKIYGFMVCPQFTFVECGQELLKYLKYQPEDETGSCYYWKDSDARYGFIEDMENRSKELPDKIIEFQDALKTLISSISLVK